MTLIMAWRESDLPRVWVVSDSRLSAPGGRGLVRLTDRAAKLLSADLILRRQTPQSVLGTPIVRQSLAFAYAGSSLVALQSYAAILPLWSHLQSVGDERLPSIEACAAHLGVFVAAYAYEVSAARGAFQPCECALIGFDEQRGTSTAGAFAPMSMGTYAQSFANSIFRREGSRFSEAAPRSPGSGSTPGLQSPAPIGAASLWT